MKLNPRLDPLVLAAAFKAQRRLHVPDVLDAASAVRLAGYLRDSDRWRHLISAGDKVFEVTRPDLAAMDAGARVHLDATVNAAARAGFQFRYDSIRVDDDAAARRASATPLDALAELLGGPDAVALFRTVTGHADIDFADAQATMYNPGDFLTGHDDNVAGKGRRAAYVLNLTQGWRAEWGGLLLFHGADGHIERGFVPRFNSLNLFEVPQDHSVSQVTPFAGGPRLSVTGWLRSRSV